MDFNFPFTPYPIQIDLMTNIYNSLDKGKVSIIESPTGTGKSLSIICATLKWIQDFKSKRIAELNDKIKVLQSSKKNSHDWIADQLEAIHINNEITDLKGKLDKIADHQEYSKKLLNRIKTKKSAPTVKFDANSKRSSVDSEFEEEVDVDLVVDFEESVDDEEKDDKYYSPKVFYCSRTHSQLSQFINEVKKTKYADPLMIVPLGSRANFCINPLVNRSTNINIVNDKCAELHKSKTKCQMSAHSRLEELSEDVLAKVQDIEDIVSKGKSLKACPYYSSRQSVSQAEIVILPYNILFHRSTRENYGINLRDSVVIVDEAHNLLESVTSIYSVELKCKHVEGLLKSVSLYMSKFYSRFNSLNLMHLKQLVFILKQLLVLFKSIKENQSFDPLELVIRMKIENINVYKIVEFLDKSRLAFKLQAFSAKQKECSQNEHSAKKVKNLGTLLFLNKIKATTNKGQVLKPLTTNREEGDELSKNPTENATDEISINSNTMHTLKDFLFSLKNFSINGKILSSVNAENNLESSLKYILLDPSSQLKVKVLSKI